MSGEPDDLRSDEDELVVGDDEWVVRFGESPDQTLINDCEEHEWDHPGEWAVSSVVGHMEPDELARLRPWMTRSRQIHFAYAAELREAAFGVYSDGRPHGNIVFPDRPVPGGTNLALFRSVMRRTLPNPNYVPKR